MDKTIRRVLVALVVLGAGAALAACGSSSSSTRSSSAAGNTSTSASAAGGGPASGRRAALAACLKQHGVTLPTRPAGAPGGGTAPRGGGGFLFGGGGRGFAANPKLRAAFQACAAQFGFRGGGGFRARISRTAIAKYVTCVRQHGYDLPDPNFSGKGPVFPSNIRTNAKFQAASRACQSLLVPSRPPSAAPTTSGA